MLSYPGAACNSFCSVSLAWNVLEHSYARPQLYFFVLCYLYYIVIVLLEWAVSLTVIIVSLLPALVDPVAILYPTPFRPSYTIVVIHCANSFPEFSFRDPYSI
jgi:hypothetical protein